MLIEGGVIMKAIVEVRSDEKHACNGCIFAPLEDCSAVASVIRENGLTACIEGFIYQVRDGRVE